MRITYTLGGHIDQEWYLDTRIETKNLRARPAKTVRGMRKKEMNIKDMLKAAGFTETVNSEVSTSWKVDVEPVGVVRLQYEVVDGEVTVIGELQLPNGIPNNPTADEP